MSFRLSLRPIVQLFVLIAALLLITSIFRDYLTEAVTKDTIVTSKKTIALEEPAFNTLRKMGRGINILGYDGIWNSDDFNPFKAHYFSMIRKAGFGHVRINLHAFDYMDNSHRLTAHFLKQLDRIIDLTVTAGLVPVIDQHNVELCQKNPTLCTVRLQAFWQQLVKHYRGRYPSLVFEFLNEPGGNMSTQAWNQIFPKVLRIIRATSPARTVIIAAINDGDPHMVHRMKLPKEDRNIIVTVHYYKPFNFTHQGAPWADLGASTGIDWGTQAEKNGVIKDFRIINDWARANHRPVYLGEFGVYEKADSLSRTRWMDFITREAERLGWRWAYWQFDHDFKLFDTEKRSWERPILDAIMDR